MRRAQAIQAANPPHGHCRRGSQSPTYKSWRGMIGRCRDASNYSYCRYGARGIKVCERWMRFKNFLADMGERPEGKSIDRLNNDGNYEPGNCKWSTRSEQMANSRPALKTEYVCGHPKTPENTYQFKGCSKLCKTCHKARAQRNRNRARGGQVCHS